MTLNETKLLDHLIALDNRVSRFESSLMLLIQILKERLVQHPMLERLENELFQAREEYEKIMGNQISFD